ncbi:magnesium protoporphyrin IX methyltransferase, chloroplastic [Cinnamomum micranthum f. kanehirae]|uniref:Magnesium protoporphyrin IX methyltransferase, chloroplastic n=1 Tax=Cinnamomum micranthum f. kanehirae TaxID=337451 RepID=A0A3S3MXV9_9MAGN|nr:magnesium protoporphyrin IX methyltransferase, chloroplastic [Cinnamomum micranthum f. kanehirae]
MAFSTPLSSSPPFSFPTPKPSFSKTLFRPKTLALPEASAAAAAAATAAPFDSTSLAVLGGGSLAALAAVLSLSDPEIRRRQQAVEVGGGDKEVVREYFNGTGFKRWKKIYGDTDDVNTVQLDIRLGHSKTVENVIKMLTDDKDGGRTLRGVTVCDAGCGTGSLTIPLAKEGAVVSASDISASMVAEAERQVREALADDAGGELVMPQFQVGDLESLEGKFDTVVCLDVLIHYPQSKADAMIAHLASLAERRLVLSFAPKTLYYDLLKRVGELFPGPSKATRAYLHAEKDVERALEKVGWRIRKRGLITTQFYFAKLIEAVPAA